MIETREKTIDGAVYSVTQLPARRALKMKARLLKMFGATLGQLFNDSKNVCKAFEVLSQTLDENAFETLCIDLLTGVRKSGIELTPATVDIEFAGDIAGLYKVLWFVIEVNYENFFQMMGIGIQDIEQMKNPLPETTKKTFIKT